jgi:hypothetical protein
MPVYTYPLSYRLRSLITLYNCFTVAIGVIRKRNLASPLVNIQVLLSKPVYFKDNIYLLS